MPGTGHPRDPSLSELIAMATEHLRLVDQSDSPDEQQRRVAEAAVLVEQVAKRLRGPKSGRDVILELLKSASPEEVQTKFLRHASGIQEFGRRIREFRV